MERSRNPFALVMLIAKEALLTGKDIDAKLLKGKLSLFKRLYSRGVLEKRKFKTIFTFLKNYVPFKNPELEKTFEKGIDEITKKPNTMDLLELDRQWAIEDARIDEKNLNSRQFIATLLLETDHSIEKIARLVRVPVEAVERVKAGMRIIEPESSEAAN